MHRSHGFAAFLSICWALALCREAWRLLAGPGDGGSVLQEAPRVEAPGAALGASEALRCLASLSTAPEPWLAIFGDSLSRGAFFDIVELLNGSSASATSPAHPGHSANFSEGCTIMEARPPTNRSKCGGFEFVVPLARGGDVAAAWAPGRVAGRAAGALGSPPPPGGAAPRRLRLSYRLKTFTWEPLFDDPFLTALPSGTPDVLLTSFGIWDMQYPPSGEAALGLGAFNASLRHFVAAVQEAWGRRGGGPQTRQMWLTVTAVSDAKLPDWKRPRMSTQRAREYNLLAAPLLRAHGFEVVDTFSIGLKYPEESRDGVHYPGRVSRLQTQLLMKTLCRGSRT